MSIETSVARVAGQIQSQTDLIAQIKTALADKAAGGVELPTLENPGTASDLAQGKQLIDADGNVVEGTVTEHTPASRDLYKSVDRSDWVSEYDPEESKYCIHSTTTFENDALVRQGSTVEQYVWGSELGNAKREDVPQGVTFTSENGLKVEGAMKEFSGYLPSYNPSFEVDYEGDFGIHLTMNEKEYLKDGAVSMYYPATFLGGAMPEDVRAGVTFTSEWGVMQTGEALLPSGGSVYPEGAFAPVSSFTDGKQYALVAVIDGVRRYINNTAYNSNTLNATQITIAEDAGDYVIFSTTPVLFTAVASGDGFLLQNGINYLHGKPSPGAVLSVNETQAVWTVDTSETAGLNEGKYLPKEDPNAVWLFNYNEGYNWTIKFETANNSFGYDRNGRDSSNSTGYVSFVLYEQLEGGEVNPIVDSSDANVTADKMLAGYSGYAKGKKVNGNIELQSKTVTENGTVTPDAGKLLSSVVVNVPTGSGGSVIKTGTTTSATIATGLSSIEEFFIYKESVSATGLIHLHYSKTDGTSYLYASAWSTSSYGTKTIKNETTAATVSGGSITLPSSTATSGGLSSGVTYTWVAIGTE